MKHPFLFILFLCAISACQPQVNTTLTAKFVNPDISQEDMLLAKKQIEARLGNIKAMNSKVTLDKASKKITFQGANKVSNKLSRKFQSLFKKSKFEVRPIKDVERDDLRALMDSLPEVKGVRYLSSLEYYKGSGVLGYVKKEINQENVLSILNGHFARIKDLKIMISKVPTSKGTKNNGLYQLYLIEMGGEKYISQSYISGATSFTNKIDNTTQVKVSLNHKGAKILAGLTTDASRNDNRSLALLYNDCVLSAPSVMTPITSGILVLAYEAQEKELAELADILSMGPLSYDLENVE